MQTKGEFIEQQILKTDIRDTNAKTSTVVNLQGLNKKSLVVVNGLNQNVSVQIQGSADNGTFINIGTAQTVNSSTNAIIGPNEVAALNNYFPYIRATATCSVGPASGTLTITTVASL